MKKIKIITIVIAVLSITGCIYTPRLITVYDDKCKIEVKHMVLDANHIQILSGCTDEDCIIGSILVAGVLSAGSAVISGSIVVTSNIVYWLEKPNQCK